MDLVRNKYKSLHKYTVNIMTFHTLPPSQQFFPYHKENDMQDIIHRINLLWHLQNVVPTPNTNLQSGRHETDIDHIEPMW